ncbi:peptidoglycan-binding domain-containing protein [Crocosphaera sp.]|uniref:peptidoglycan-binding domain-containing protein n=1 Tax=Crocosphaera sp. TaxID=2729996 RepID=UPI0026207348|nr:peptidoglycan-binding domain-containing protein [Crocosphaera sp.]MDJ0579201.1 peptidoglycan-binding domain-containing protein [Crocosphaera sp.]
MSNLITINEFSRKFDEPKWSDKHKKYVAGGFHKEIGFRTEKVPPEIEKAITENKLRINDNYPLESGEISLIAREISQYSILAVASKGVDYASRPLICYRYFWLENADTYNFDGVATLLKWWEEKDKPYCEIKPWAEYENELTENGEDFYQATPIDKKYSEPFQQQIKSYQKQTNKNLDTNQIEEKPYIFSIHKNDSVILPNYWGIHALALQLNNKYENADIAWSWNTSVMDETSNFTLICCANEKNFDLQQKWDSSSQKLVPRPFPVPLSLYKKLSKELIKIAQRNKKLQYDDSPNLYHSLETGDSTTWDYEQLIDGTSYVNKLDENQKIYFKLIILLLNPNNVFKQTTSGRINVNISDLIPRMIPQSTSSQPTFRGRIPTQGFSFSAHDTAKVAVTTMQRFLYFCDKYLSDESYQRLTRNIYNIINQLCLEIISSTPSQEFSRAVKTILVDDSNQKNQLNAYHFQIYLGGYENNLISWLNEYYKYNANKSIKTVNDNNKIDDFCKQVIKDLIAYEQQKRNKNVNYPPKLTTSLFDANNELMGINQTQSSQKFTKYQDIAEIFYSARCYNLAALFSQLSLGYVPQVIYNKCSNFYEIIELTLEKKSPEAEETLNNSNLETPIDDNSFSTNPFSIITRNFFVGLLFLGIGVGGSFVVDRFFLSSSPSFTVEETQPFSDKFDYYRQLSQARVSERNTAQIKDSLIQDIRKINDTNTGIPKLQYFPKDKKAQTAKELQKAFIEQRKDQLEKINAYPYISSLTPKIEQKLSQEILAEMTVTKASAENPTVNENVKQLSAMIQPFLQSLGFSQIKLSTNTWDKNTSDAIKKFKLHYKLLATGNLDQETWNILYIMIKDKQVKETAIVLESILQFRQNSRESEEKLTELENCKNEPVTYLQCIDKLKTKPAN